jgi:hypothetical protein
MKKVPADYLKIHSKYKELVWFIFIFMTICASTIKKSQLK